MSKHFAICAAFLFACAGDPTDPMTGDGDGDGDGDVGDGDGDGDGDTGPDAAVALEVPTDASELFVFLSDGAYAGFEAEASVHPSAGPHGSGVRSFFTGGLADSLRSGASVHPQGSAVIKELHGGGGLSGWAVMVKTGSGTSASDWYFYEVLSTTPGTTPVADGNGASGCAGCHSGGTDYIHTSAP